MKKIVTLIVLFLAISFNVSAQDSNPDTKAAADITALKKVITLSESNQKAVYEVFYYKHKSLTQTNLSDTQKQEITTETETRLASILTEAQLAKVRTNEEFYRKLVQ